MRRFLAFGVSGRRESGRSSVAWHPLIPLAPSEPVVAYCPAMPEPIRQLRDLHAHSRWNAAIELLRRHIPEEAATAVIALPFNQQRLLFRRLPIDLAATL